VYHDLPGLATTTLSADVQTSGAAGPASPDMLMVLRVDSQRRGFPIGANNPSVGLMMARLAQECRPHRGPVATGVRLQDCVRMSGPGGAPVELDVALGKVRACSSLQFCDQFCVRPTSLAWSVMTHGAPTQSSPTSSPSSLTLSNYCLAVAATAAVLHFAFAAVLPAWPGA
jgi:hypothetical protein